MSQFEQNYLSLAKTILSSGNAKRGRNGETFSLFGTRLEIDSLEYGLFPLLTTRKIHYKGVLGEFAAFFRGVKNIKDFKKFGCNYWDMWAGENGDLKLDYGNKWLDFHGKNQIVELIETLKTNPDSRRMLVTGWDPSSVDSLSLPCCHYSYQFYVRNGRLDILWNQRSADFMVGVPSDIVFAAVWVIVLANMVGLKPGKIIMMFGDTHIYMEHTTEAIEQMKREPMQLPTYEIDENVGLFDFVPENLIIKEYQNIGLLNYVLKL